MAPSHAKSKGARLIQGLEPCAHVPPERRRLSWAPCQAACSHSLENGHRGLTRTEEGRGLSVRFPVELAFGAAPPGFPDLRIELVQLSWGSTDACRHALDQHAARNHSLWVQRYGSTARNPEYPSIPGSSMTHGSQTPVTTATAGAVCSPRHASRDAQSCGQQAGGLSNDQHSVQSYEVRTKARQRLALAQYMSSAGAVLLFSVLHADAAAAARSFLLLPGLAFTLAEAVEAAAATMAGPRNRADDVAGWGQRDESGASGAGLCGTAGSNPAAVEASCVALEVPRGAAGCAGTRAAAAKPGHIAGVRSPDMIAAAAAVSGSQERNSRPAAEAAEAAKPTSVAVVTTARAEAGLASGARVSAGRLLWRMQRRIGGLLARGTRRAASPLADGLQRVAVPSALLCLAGKAWRVVHSSSAALADAVVDLLAVGLSYSWLAREAQLGRMPPGRPQELAWRRLHKAAAQRLARHLTDLPTTPPLAPALAALEHLSIAAALAVDGVPLCGAADTLAAAAAGATGAAAVTGGSGTSRRCDGGRHVAFSVSYGRRRIRESRASPSQTDEVSCGPSAVMEDVSNVAPQNGSTTDATVTERDNCGSGRAGVAAISVTAAATAATLAYASTPPQPLPLPPPAAPSPPLPRHLAAGCRGYIPDGHVTACPSAQPAAAAAAARTAGEVGPAPLAAGLDTTTPDLGPALPKQAETVTGCGALAGPSAAPASAGDTVSDRRPNYATVASGVLTLSTSEAEASRAQAVPSHLATQGVDTSSGTVAPAQAPNGPTGTSAAVRGLPRAASASSLTALAAAAGAAPSPATGLARVAAAVIAPLCGSTPVTGSCPGPQSGSLSGVQTPGGSSSSSGVGVGVVSAEISPLPLPAAAARIGIADTGRSGLVSVRSGRPRSANVVSAVAGRPRRRSLMAWLPAGFWRAVELAAGWLALTSRYHGTTPAPSPTSFTRQMSPAEDPPSPPAVPECQQQHFQHQPSPIPEPVAAPGYSPPSAFTPHATSGALELRNLSRVQAMQLLKQEQAEAEALGLPLCGKADHAHLTELDRPKGPRERWELACRGAYLLAVFLPFLTLGICLLLLSVLVTRGSPSTTGSETKPTSASQPAAAASGSAPSSLQSSGGSSSVAKRSCGGGGWRGSVALGCRRRAWRLLLAGCRRSGAAFIKWGQWSATRVDLFPDDFCEALSELHDRAPTHSAAFTRRQVERSFGVPLEAMFEAFDPKPIASGSIAQVHRALMRCSDGSPLDVAVKVVHPNVERRIRQDFALLRPAAAALGRLRSLRSLSLPETVAQFSCTMTAQADLRVEAAHLRRFYVNFSRVGGQVTTPRPLPGLVRTEVMVETWEPGRSVAHYIRHPGPLNTAVVCLGVDTYLKMLLQDNFVHTDLHPGNIMVRLLGPEGQPAGVPADSRTAAAGAAGVAASASGPSGGNASTSAAAATAAGDAAVQLVLLDFGLAEELTPSVRHHFISFLHHLMRGDGVAAASHILRWTTRPQACPDPAALTADMVALTTASCDVRSAAGIDLDAVMKDVLRLARKHSVTIDSSYASLVIAVCVIVGFATSLDPGVNLVDAAVPAFLAHALTGRVVGRLYS